MAVLLKRQEAFARHVQQQDEQRFRNGLPTAGVINDGGIQIVFFDRQRLRGGGDLILFQAYPCRQIIRTDEQERQKRRQRRAVFAQKAVKRGVVNGSGIAFRPVGYQNQC